MKEYDQVKLVVEKERYAKNDVHKGMVGWICDGDASNGTWLVSFEQYGESAEIACISVREEDLMSISPPEYTVKNNTRILEAWKSREEDLTD